MIDRLLQPIYNLRLKHKIVLCCAMLVIVSTGFSGMLLYRYASQVTTETSNVHSSEVMVQVSNYLNEKLKGIITRGLSLRSDRMFNETAVRFLASDDPRYYASALSYFSNVFLEMRYSEPFISSVFLYTPKGSFYDLSLSYRTDQKFTETAMFKAISAQPDNSVYWLPRSKSELYRQDESVVSLVLRFSVSGYNDELYMVIHLKEQLILDYLRNAQLGEGSSTIIVDSGGNTIASSDSPVTRALHEDAAVWNQVLSNERGFAKMDFGTDSYGINYIRTNVAPWTIINIQSRKALLEKLRSMKIYSAAILLISITLSFGLAYLVSATISRPLVALERTMQQVRLRRFDARFEYPYEDEVGKLGRTFNFMTEEIHHLVGQQESYIVQLQNEKERAETEQKLKRIAELKALQSQMTPHFLYNTLDSIKWMAEKSGEWDIVRMITALASFFRTSLSRGKEIIPIKEEIGHVASYLRIQQIRYEDRFVYEFHIDESIDKQMTVKFILQPLVENAIYHGIKLLPGQGVIKISVEAEEAAIKLSVEDNGPGIHPVKLQLIRRRFETLQQEHSDGYGLYNVNDRIRLYFGEPYGLQIDSLQGRGTKVTALIPIMNREEDARHV
ncbi:sensor histidine kinase [Paenibacillus hamazuiensis]|uniref:sensor histidine kinase n=1 Tax=Paenibacillus hamazuiensis TaxID=2936508 RepID=UPI00200C3B1F|nr:sensor histidine kinase [Paenibacillus hamazuiensis]